MRKKALGYQAKGRTYVYSPLVTEQQCVAVASRRFWTGFLADRFGRCWRTLWRSENLRERTSKRWAGCWRAIHRRHLPNPKNLMETTSVNSFLIALARSSIEAGILVMLVLVTQWVFQKQLAARWRCALWLVVVARLLLPFSFSSVTSVFNLLPRWTPPPAPPSSVATPLPATAASHNPVTSSSTAAPPFEPTDSFAPIVRHTWSWSWPVAIFVVWLAGVILLTGYVLVLSFRFWRRCAGLRSVDEAAVLDVLDECCARLKVRTKPALLESVEVRSPALYGLFRPRMLLPKGFISKFSPAELRFVFLHELAHLKRRDLLVNWVMTAVQILHWFNPLVWLAFTRWRADRVKLACDAMALEAARPGAKQGIWAHDFAVTGEFYAPDEGTGPGRNFGR